MCFVVVSVMLLRILRLLVAIVAVVEVLCVRPVHAFRCWSIGQAGSIRRISLMRSVRKISCIRSERSVRSISCIRGCRRHAVRWRGQHQPLPTRPIIAAESISNISPLLNHQSVRKHLGILGEIKLPVDICILNLMNKLYNNLYLTSSGEGC